MFLNRKQLKNIPLAVEQTGSPDPSERLLPMVPEYHSFDAHLRLISPETLRDVMGGVFADRLSGFTVVDCRFPYEYHGGHINGAINLWRLEQVMHSFITTPEIRPHNPRTHAIIFHCEFSSHRAPTQCKNLR